jgi:hypothetical protein
MMDNIYRPTDPEIFINSNYQLVLLIHSGIDRLENVNSHFCCVLLLQRNCCVFICPRIRYLAAAVV